MNTHIESVAFNLKGNNKEQNINMLKLNDIEFYNTPSGGVMVSVEGDFYFIANSL